MMVTDITSKASLGPIQHICLDCVYPYTLTEIWTAGPLWGGTWVTRDMPKGSIFLEKISVIRRKQRCPSWQNPFFGPQSPLGKGEGYQMIFMIVHALNRSYSIVNLMINGQRHISQDQNLPFLCWIFQSLSTSIFRSQYVKPSNNSDQKQFIYYCLFSQVYNFEKVIFLNQNSCQFSKGGDRNVLQAYTMTICSFSAPFCLIKTFSIQKLKKTIPKLSDLRQQVFSYEPPGLPEAWTDIRRLMILLLTSSKEGFHPPIPFLIQSVIDSIVTFSVRQTAPSPSARKFLYISLSQEGAP